MRARPLAERFAEKTTPAASGCLEWTARRNACGYGTIKNGVDTVLAHRVAWMLAFGPVPADVCVCHRCDNPRCVNVEHLFLGTRHDNMRDMATKGRAAKGPTSAGIAKYAKLTREDAELIRLAWDTLPVTQFDLAKAFGVNQPQISRVIHGKCWAA